MKTSIVILFALIAIRLNSQTATDLPPVVNCPADSTVECKTPARVTVAISDPEGDALTVVWAVNGKHALTNTVPASTPPGSTNVVPTSTNLTFSAVLPLGTNVIAITATDSATNSASCSTKVTVVDTTPPVIVTATASPKVLWPPNHKLVNIALSAKVTDACSTASWKIAAVTSSEASVATGAGKPAPDWQITGPHTLKLRSERTGSGTDRVYSIFLVATDAVGNVSPPTILTVRVPHDQGKGK